MKERFIPVSIRQNFPNLLPDPREVLDKHHVPTVPGVPRQPFEPSLGEEKQRMRSQTRR